MGWGGSSPDPEWGICNQCYRNNKGCCIAQASVGFQGQVRAFQWPEEAFRFSILLDSF